MYNHAFLDIMNRKTLSVTEYKKEIAKFHQPDSSVSTKRSRMAAEPTQSINLLMYTEEFLSALIEKVKQKPILWNKRNASYSNNWAKNKTWNEVDKELENLSGMLFCAHSDSFALLFGTFAPLFNTFALFWQMLE